MRLDIVVADKQELPAAFTELFSEVNHACVDDEQPVEAQVSAIEEKLGAPSLESMLIYSEKYSSLGTVLSRRYANAAKIGQGPLKMGDAFLSPVHVSCLPNESNRNRILFLAPHFEEAYIAAVLPHKTLGDEVFLHSFTSMKETERIKQVYKLLGLSKDDYALGSLEVNSLFKKKDALRKIIWQLLDEYNPDAVFSVYPDCANFDHIAVAEVVKDIVLKQTEKDLIYGHVIQSRNKNPVLFPLLSETAGNQILKAYGKSGFGELFKKYLTYLRHEMHAFSEPLLRMIGEGRLQNVYTLPLETERMANYRIPNLLDL